MICCFVRTLCSALPYVARSKWFLNISILKFIWCTKHRWLWFHNDFFFSISKTHTLFPFTPNRFINEKMMISCYFAQQLTTPHSRAMGTFFINLNSINLRQRLEQCTHRSFALSNELQLLHMSSVKSIVFPSFDWIVAIALFAVNRLESDLEENCHRTKELWKKKSNLIREMQTANEK